MKPSILAEVGMAMLAYPLSVSAQQFALGSYPFEVFNLTDTCFETLNATFHECSFLLNGNLASPEGHFEPVDKVHLNHICVPTCREALVNFRPKVEAACNTTKDAVAFTYGHIVYPPTYQTDLLIVGYDVHCYKDRDTGKFCDLLLTEWKTRRDTDLPLECEDCTLEQWRRQLEAPIRYSDEGASKFSEATSACSATGYEYVKPTTYYNTTLPMDMDMDMETSLESFATSVPTPTP